MSFEIEAEKETLVNMLNKAMKQKIALQLMVGELREISRPGRVVHIMQTHLQFEELYFQNILMIPLSDISGIVEKANGRSAFLENLLPEISKFSNPNQNSQRVMG